MKVTIETDDIHVTKMLSAIEENKELRLSVEAAKTELEKEKEKYDLLVEAIKACTLVFSTGMLYYDDSNTEAKEIIKGIL